MRNLLKGLLAAAVIAAPVMTNASTLIGEWTGTATNVFPAYDGPQLLDLNFLTETPDGSSFDLTGTIAVTCVDSSDPGCGTGGEFISLTGSLAANDGLTFTAPDGPSFVGSVSFAQDTITGSVTHPGSSFTADYALSEALPNAAPELDPTSAAGGLALLVGGLLMLRGRKQQDAAS